MGVCRRKMKTPPPKAVRPSCLSTFLHKERLWDVAQGAWAKRKQTAGQWQGSS